MSLIDVVRKRGPLTVAAFMDLALYDPQFGYYARSAQRSGRAGDFFTSVDVGPLFGRLLAEQIAEMGRLLASSPAFDLVEVGAGNGRLSADVLRGLRSDHPSVYARTRLHLVESSAAAREQHATTLGECSGTLASSSPSLPERFEGVVFANELFDAMPVHQVVMRPAGLREVYVTVRDATHTLVTTEGPPSTAAFGDYLRRVGATLEPGWRVEIGLRAVDWIRELSSRLVRGFVILIDYGHEARDLFSASHSSGTLTTFAGHRAAGAESGRDRWLESPGEQDITAHVDFTTIRQTFREEGFVELGYLDQTHFLLGLMQKDGAEIPELSMRERLVLKTLLMPGGLGSTMKVLLLGKEAGTPTLGGVSFGMRAT